MASTKGEEWIKRWKGKTVVCIASGPSLTAEDCESVRHLPAIVTNTTFRMAPWADALFGFDGRWWSLYGAEVAQTFKGMGFTCAQAGRNHGAQDLLRAAWFSSFHNSGANAVSLAIAGGASRVLLLGFDCQRTGGKTHWHGDHPKTLSNAKSLDTWPMHFRNLSRYATRQGVEVLNCSRETALRCFPRVSLEDALKPSVAAEV